MKKVLITIVVIAVGLVLLVNLFPTKSITPPAPVKRLLVGGGGLLSPTQGFVQSGTSVYLNTSTNFVGVGTSTPYGQLSISASDLAAPAPIFVISSSTIPQFIVTSGGMIGFGTSTPANQFSVVGDSLFSSNLGTTTLKLHSTMGQRGGCIEIEGPASTTYRLYINANGPALQVEAGSCE